jgi:hypothetical protein
MSEAINARTTSPSIPSTRTFRFVAARITASHRELIERLQRVPPNEIDPRLHADAEDLEHRAETLRCHLLAVKDYVSEYLHDTASLSWSVNVDRKYVEASIRDLINEIVGPIEIAAETVRQEAPTARPDSSRRLNPLGAPNFLPPSPQHRRQAFPAKEFQ